jgi:AraC-like DNA-binding protein
MLDFNFSINHLVSILTIGVGFLYAFQIGSLKKVKTNEGKYFTYFLLVLTSIVFLFLIVDLKLGFKALNFSLIFLILTSVLLVPPLMWLYIKKLISYEDNVKDIYHFLPSIIVSLSILISILGYYLTLSPVFFQILTNIVFIVLIVIFLLQNIYYIYKSIHSYLKHKSKIEEIYSYSEEVDVSWIKILIVGYVTFIASMIIVNYFDGELSNIVFNLVILIYIIYIGHNAMKQNSITISDIKGMMNDIEDSKDKQLSEAQLKVFQKIKEDLLEMMVEEKPYLDQNLNIFTLAKKLNTNSKYLSQVINQEFNKSFVHFINEYRIEEAKQILLANNNYTIEAQSQMVGFKSKSSFNIAFKRHTGLTPSLYIQNNS